MMENGESRARTEETQKEERGVGLEREKFRKAACLERPERIGARPGGDRFP